jgi:hypothetical protein
MRSFIFLLAGSLALSGCYVISGTRAQSGAFAVMAPVHVANIVDTEEEIAPAFQRSDKELIANVGSKFELTMRATSADVDWTIVSMSNDGIVELDETVRDEKDPSLQRFRFASLGKGKVRLVFEYNAPGALREEYMTVTVE